MPSDGCDSLAGAKQKGTFHYLGVYTVRAHPGILALGHLSEIKSEVFCKSIYRSDQEFSQCPNFDIPPSQTWRARQASPAQLSPGILIIL